MADLTRYQAYEVTRSRDYNPDTGISLLITYAGTEAKMTEIQDYWANAAEYDGTPLGYGYKTHWHKTSAGVVLTVRIPDEILYTEKWNLDTEIISLSVWWNEEFREYNPATAALDLSTINDLQSYMFRIGIIMNSVKAVQSGSELTLAFQTFPPSGGGAADLGPLREEEIDLIFDIVRDGTAMEWKRPVLKRARMMPAPSTDRTSLVGRQFLYTTNDLIDVFAIPDDIVAQISTVDSGLPTAFPNTAWSWKERRNDSQTVQGSAKYLESRDWVYGRWSTIRHVLYEP